MRIFITGATGLIGTALVEILLVRKDQITVLTRNPESAKLKFGTQVDYCRSLDSLSSLDGYDAVINLAGESIGGRRWSEKQKERLKQSRYRITQKLSELILNSDNPPGIFISGSAVGYYGNQHNTIITETTVANKGFTHDLCKQWEAYASEAASSKTRVCLLRTSIVLSTKGGMLPQLLTPFKMGLGSVMGNGDQYLSWIHIDDMVGAISYLLRHAEAKGAFNMAAPGAVTNKEFSLFMAKNLHRPCWFRIPKSFIKIVFGESSALLLDSQRAIPKRLEKLGYSFKFKNIDDAMRDLLKPDLLSD